MIASAAPPAIAANVVRLGSIILAAQAFGQEAGNRVHESWWMSLLPYVPAIGGLLLLGRWLSERPQPQPEPATPLISQAQSNP